MKRLVYSLLLAVALLVPAINLAAATPVGAVDLLGGFCGSGDSASTSDVCKERATSKGSTQNPIIHVISIAINLLAFIIGIASLIMIIVSGFRMVLSRGDPQSFANARNAIIYAFVGLVIAGAAGAIVSLVLSNL